MKASIQLEIVRRRKTVQRKRILFEKMKQTSDLKNIARKNIERMSE